MALQKGGNILPSPVRHRSNRESVGCRSTESGGSAVSGPLEALGRPSFRPWDPSGGGKLWLRSYLLLKGEKGSSE